jgi:hypothetical protein
MKKDADMEIGGCDLIFDKPESDPTWGLVSLCRKTWPEAVIQFDPEPGHFFVYRNMATAFVWDKDVPEDDFAREGMIYFIVGSDTFTAVVESLGGDCVADLKATYKLKEPDVV